MRLGLRLVGFVLLFMGTVWFFQGVGLLPGSFMSGQPRWAVNGVIAVAVGLVFLVLSRRLGSRATQRPS